MSEVTAGRTGNPHSFDACRHAPSTGMLRGYRVHGCPLTNSSRLGQTVPKLLLVYRQQLDVKQKRPIEVLRDRVVFNAKSPSVIVRGRSLYWHPSPSICSGFGYRFRGEMLSRFTLPPVPPAGSGCPPPPLPPCHLQSWVVEHKVQSPLPAQLRGLRPIPGGDGGRRVGGMVGKTLN